MLQFPDISPIAFSIGPVTVRWYALAYLAGFILGWQYCLRIIKNRNWTPVTAAHLDDLLLWIMVGVIAGGRIGYVLFYQLPYYAGHPADIVKIWHGGMSFHGGFLGVLVASALFARRHGLHFFQITDILACATPIGLFFGRIANFINGELYGRPSSLPWAMVFPGSDGQPRHPSQFYEAMLEGVALFLILFVLMRRDGVGRAYGTLSGVFLIGYGGFRFVVEFFRQPDVQIGLIGGVISMGQILCLPMIGAGAAIIWWAGRANRKRMAQNAG